jgi:3-isopropylmalate dehydratase small subunit
MGLPKRITGRVWKLGDHINTDILHPSPYFSLNEARVKEGVAEGMERLGTKAKFPHPPFTKGGRGGILAKDNPSDDGIIIVAGENFGCGSSRETSVRGLRSFGVRGVLAASFARIFFRSLINLGLPALECRDIREQVTDGDSVLLSIEEGWVELTDKRRFPFSPIDTHIQKILEAGGLIPYLLKERQAKPLPLRDCVVIGARDRGISKTE